ncbi:YtxH domain-containing protein [Pedobacter polaris]|uniref:YtxH domain-containing protein n=1 Tax=Pedobacter polaris TaxID=2571273 RepID=A0A4U1CSD4_9SPHI|nr:YtxH domain-containing protein [Pedobacter polaris]TKC10416.1 YtxH domain-containing protein [Pedobacter polaris]
MGFIKSALVGAAIYAGIQYITKKDILTGRSILDELLEKAPEFIDKAKIYAKEVEIKVEQPIDPHYS